MFLGQGKMLFKLLTWYIMATTKQEHTLSFLPLLSHPIPDTLSLASIPSATSVLSTYTSFAASALLIWTVLNEVQRMTNQLISQQLQEKILSRIGSLVENASSEMILESKLEGAQVKWQLICTGQESVEGKKVEHRSIELSFPGNIMGKVLNSYLPYVMERSVAIKEENKVAKLYTLGNLSGEYNRVWGSTNLDHPSTFETLVMDSKLKEDLLNDLNRFKRGYLLYGPPGTGKSSLVAAILWSNSELRRLLFSTKNKSILVMEDIDCSIEFQTNKQEHMTKLTSCGLLNFIDGLQSSCGDGRIIMFTTNHEDRLDPSLLRSRRMDLHIHMSYRTPCGFLASNYQGVSNHSLFTEIAEELMQSEDANTALEGLIEFLERVNCWRTEMRNQTIAEIQEIGRDEEDV
ncbi:hypothetical protein PVL29_001311 [Vitis rotundifolia]|uniref:AAA+ ATPase domain-containing protein n=1 Tax=Vitis rotundifolia TaxID=103349 RepID=A0AA39ALB5_VITRO|nr:hypothetical protein PVL29_001311 [Vitis rotundifolia]